MQKFLHRCHAGSVLAEQLKSFADDESVIVLALPRGGVPVAYEIAKTLHAPLDVFIVRKLGLPGYEELAMGAIASGGAVVFNEYVIRAHHVSKTIIDDVIKSEFAELNRRQKVYRGNRVLPVLKGKTVILVDDGIATGATMKVAIQALRQQSPAKIIVAVPVAPLEVYDELLTYVDKIICLDTPKNFYAVGAWYEDFSQTSDEEVSDLLMKANQESLQ
jgi:putative phosphoribosyl transferase